MLTEEQVKHFQKRGYLILFDALPKEELSLLHEEADVLSNYLMSEGYDIVKDMGCIVEPWTCGFLDEEDNQHKVSACRYRELRDSILLDTGHDVKASDLILTKYGTMASQLLTSQEIYLLNEQFIIKPPFTVNQSQFVLHRDSDYYEDARHRNELTIACWTALDDVCEENGTVELRDFLGEELVLKAPAGSILFMSSQLLHKSNGNRSSTFRRAFMAQFSRTPLLYFDRRHLPLVAQCVSLAVPCNVKAS